MTAAAAATDLEKADLTPPQRPRDSYDPEKHERPATLSSSSDDDHHDDADDRGSDAASSRAGRSLSRATSAASRTSHLSRTVSEVRDGMLNQRDLEIGEESDGSQSKERQTQDPNLVTWDGPDDKENPKNWSLNKKWIDVLLGTLFSLSSSTRCSN